MYFSWQDYLTSYRDSVGLFSKSVKNVLADAIKRAKSTDREAIRKALLATKNFKGVMSTITANSKGELVHEAVIAKIENKVPKLIKTVRE